MKAIAVAFCGLMLSASCSGCITAEKKGERRILEGVTRSSDEAQLSWEAPTTNADGSRLTDLAGYVIRYGHQSRFESPEGFEYPEEKKLSLSDPGLSCGEIISAGGNARTTCTFTVRNLSDHKHYFAVTALNDAGKESDYSNEVRK